MDSRPLHSPVEVGHVYSWPVIFLGTSTSASHCNRHMNYLQKISLAKISCALFPTSNFRILLNLFKQISDILLNKTEVNIRGKNTNKTTFCESDSLFYRHEGALISPNTWRFKHRFPSLSQNVTLLEMASVSFCLVAILIKHMAGKFVAVERKIVAPFIVYLTIIPLALMGYESIDHEAEGRMVYWLGAHEGERNNCFSKIQLVGQKNIETKYLSLVEARL